MGYARNQRRIAPKPEPLTPEQEIEIARRQSIVDAKRKPFEIDTSPKAPDVNDIDWPS